MGFENRILKKPILISSPLKHQRRTDAALQSNTHLRLRVTSWWSTTMKQQFDEQVFDVILDNGKGYRIEGDVYFSVDEFPEYRRLSGRKLEDNRAGERVAVDSRKKNPADFALWKFDWQKKNEEEKAREKE
ncbi:hypothetical protein R6Q59_010762 [Mikania micrantha]